MVLSRLQTYILRHVRARRPQQLQRRELSDFYKSCKKPPAIENQTKIITQSIERLINKGLVVGYGVKTKEKFFIKEVRLTRMGGKLARQLLGTQQVLPLKKRKARARPPLPKKNKK